MAAVETAFEKVGQAVDALDKDMGVLSRGRKPVGKLKKELNAGRGKLRELQSSLLNDNDRLERRAGAIARTRRQAPTIRGNVLDPGRFELFPPPKTPRQEPQKRADSPSRQSQESARSGDLQPSLKGSTVRR